MLLTSSKRPKLALQSGLSSFILLQPFSGRQTHRFIIQMLHDSSTLVLSDKSNGYGVWFDADSTGFLAFCN